VILVSWLAAAPARADVTLSATTEHFDWSEDTSPFRVEEDGPRFALGLDVAPRRTTGVRLAYRGKVYAGRVGYDGAHLFAPTIPISGHTVYFGTTQQGQVRVAIVEPVDFLGSLDWDLWRRELSAQQTEDYGVLSIRLGAEHRDTDQHPWRFGAGIKVPFWAREDPHLTQLGFDQDPILSPGRSTSPYAEVGRRLSSRWMVSAYWDTFRFTQSQDLTITQRGRQRATFHQPASQLSLIGLSLERDF
jgi:hypothetical protein